MLTITVGLVLPGMIAHAAEQVADAAGRLARGTVADLTRAMQALARGDLDAAHARVDVVAVTVRSRDEIGLMADSFNAACSARSAAPPRALDGAREGLRATEAQARAQRRPAGRRRAPRRGALEGRRTSRRASLREVLASRSAAPCSARERSRHRSRALARDARGLLAAQRRPSGAVAGLAQRARSRAARDVAAVRGSCAAR